jgi:hypothetical protein
LKKEGRREVHSLLPTFAVIFCGNSQQPIMLFVLFHFLTFTSPIPLTYFLPLWEKKVSKANKDEFLYIKQKGLSLSIKQFTPFFLLSLSLTMFAIFVHSISLLS